MILKWLPNNEPSSHDGIPLVAEVIASVDYYTNIPAGLIAEQSQDRLVIAEKTLAEGIKRDFVKPVLLRVDVENGDLSGLGIKLPDR